MQKINQKYISFIVKKALEEDLRPMGDITTKLVKFSDKKIKARIIAKQNGVIAGIEFCKKAFKLIGKESIFKSKVKDGKFIKKNKVIAEILANTKTILTAERTALNFLNHASGIATITNSFVEKVGKKTKICCTRKTTPNLRLLDKYAVKKGGGFNHRYNLSDEVLIKDNHIKAAKDLKTDFFIPIHWGGFTLAIHSWDEPVTQSIRWSNKTGIKCLTPEIGDEITQSMLNKKFTKWWEKY